MIPKGYQFKQHKRQLIIGLSEVSLHCLNSTCPKIKNDNNKYSVFLKIRPLIGRRIRIGRRLHVNQPLVLRMDFTPFGPNIFQY